MQTTQANLQQVAVTTNAATSVRESSPVDLTGVSLNNQIVNSETPNPGNFGKTLDQQLESRNLPIQTGQERENISTKVVPPAIVAGMALPPSGKIADGVSTGNSIGMTEQRSDDITELNATVGDPYNVMTPPFTADSVSVVNVNPVVSPTTSSAAANASWSAGQPGVQQLMADGGAGPNATSLTNSTLNTHSVIANDTNELPTTSKDVTQSIKQAATLPAAVPVSPLPQSANTPIHPTPLLPNAVSANSATLTTADKPLMNAELQHVLDSKPVLSSNNVDDARPIPSANRTTGTQAQNVFETTMLNSMAQRDTVEQSTPVISRALERMWSEGFRVSAPVTQNIKLATGLAESVSSAPTDIADLFSAESSSVRPTLNRAAPTAFGQLISQYQLNAQPGTQAWGNELNQRVVWLAQQSESQQALLQLNPRHLGPMEVHISVSADQQVSVSFTAQNASVREAIDTALPRLREMLDQQGLNLADANVSDKQTRNGEQGNDSDLKRAMNQTANDGNEALDVEGAASMITEPAADTSGRVDLYA